MDRSCFPYFSYFSYTEEDLRRMPRRAQESHKGTFGRVLCVCGSVGMCGAAYFAAKAAYRTGAGLVRVLTVRENLPMLQTMLPEAIVSVYDAQAPERAVIEDAVAWADVLVIGCGLSCSAASRSLLSDLLRLREEKPTVLDADALNLLARNPSLLKYAKGAILTPHMGEMSRLSGRTVEELSGMPERYAWELAQKCDAVCLLKGHRTVISDGSERIYRNQCGNSGMATGGSGDVLAGILGGILAQARNGSLDRFSVACLGVLIHGLCGDLAAKKKSEYSVMASDLIDALPRVLLWAEGAVEGDLTGENP